MPDFHAAIFLAPTIVALLADPQPAEHCRGNALPVRIPPAELPTPRVISFQGGTLFSEFKIRGKSSLTNAESFYRLADNLYAFPQHLLMGQPAERKNRMKKSALGVALLVGVLQTVYSAELPVSFTDEQIDKAVASAPELPVDLGFGLELKLVDYVDFTADEVLHDFRDRGSSRVVEGPAGKYRQSAAHRHAHFSVRWKSGGVDQPHLLVFEYPDDADRQICFFTHDSRLTGIRNLDWSLETGVNCGDPFPLSNRMQYHTMFSWPSDRYPVAMVMNWARNKTGAAASRLWVYAIEKGLPPLEINEPDPENTRDLGIVYNYSKIPRMCVFGGAGNEKAFEHMVEYHRFRGDNLIAWPVVVNNSWGFYCTIPAWDGGENPRGVELEQALAVCEKAGMKFLPIINAGFGFKMGGKNDADSDPAERRALIEKGFTQFMERYGNSPALCGIAFDTQDLSPNYGEAAVDQWKKSFGSLAGFRKFMKTIAPDLPLFHFLGGKGIHVSYFKTHGDGGTDCGSVLKRWEEGNTAWSEHLANEAKTLWTAWNRDPAELNSDGIETILNYQVDDARIFDTYFQNPRAEFYRDMEASAEKAALINTRKAMVWNTFYEGYIGLNPYNWYYQKLWVAPDFSLSPPYGLYGQTLAMSHRDRDMMLVGAWGRKGGGIEQALRKFAVAFRALPPGELEPIEIQGNSPLIARGIAGEEKFYLNMINPTPFDQSLNINGETALLMKPFSIITHELSARPALSGEAAATYTEWVLNRLKKFKADMVSIRKINPDAVSEAYDRHLKKAAALFTGKKIYAADQALGHGLQRELDTRLAILQPRELKVPKMKNVPELDAPFDQWPEKAADWQTDASHIATHLFFPGQWDGKDDLSARIRCAHDDKTLAFTIRVSDQNRQKRDDAVMHFSAKNYLTWALQLSKYETTIPIPLPVGSEPEALGGPFGMNGTVCLVEGGYEIAVQFDLELLPLHDSRIGWVFGAGDDDENSSAKPNGWARKQALLFPNDPLYQYWNDARTCAELVLE